MTPAAAAERGEAIGRELVGSFTLGAGQFCTKPGLVLVPSGPDGDAVVTAMAEAVRGSAPQVMLNAGIADSFGRGAAELAATPGLRILARGADGDGRGFGAVDLVSSPASRAKSSASSNPL